MSPHLSQEIRQVWSKELGKSNAEIAELVACCERTVREVLRLEREHAVVYNPHAKPRRRARLLNFGDLNYISSLISANPVIYLDEVCERLVQYRNADVSLSTISRAMHKMALSRKQVSPAALERNELLRATWQAAYADIPADYIVWLDESSVDNRTNHRQMGWAEVGRACVSREFFIHGQCYSVLPALTCDGYIALDIFEGSVNKERFITFLTEQVVCPRIPLQVRSVLTASYAFKAPKLNPYSHHISSEETR